MPYLRVRYRHEVKCQEPDCGELVVREGQLSDAVYPDGILVMVDADKKDIRSAFSLRCPAGHQIDLFAPRDLQIMKSGSIGDADCSPITLRSSLLS
jgi:hypothetical protein